MRTAPITLLATLASLTACGVAESHLVDHEGNLEHTAPLTAQVQVLEAHSVIGTTLNGEWAPYQRPLQGLGYGPGLTGVVRGLVSVSTAAADSRVFIHFSSHFSNEPARPWKVVEARRVDAGHWEFSTEPLTQGAGYHYIPRFVHTFAVEHRTAQGSTWDNNGGRNYLVSGDDDGGWVPVFAGPTAVMRGNLVVEQAWWDGAMLRGTLVVRNVGYGKRVSVIATTTHWASQRLGVANWVKVFSGTDFERWSFEVVAPATDTELVEFAAALDAPGRATEWDNNLTRNYSLRLDGVGSPWALGVVRSPGRVVFGGPAGGWQVRVERQPPADGALTLVYDPARLPTCRGSKYGQPAWAITSYLRPGTAPFTEQPFVPSSPGQLLRTPVMYAPDAHGFEVYFLNTDVNGCVAYDSNHGANFTLRW